MSGPAPTTPLGEGERLLHGAPANRLVGHANVGGRLWLTTRRLIFEPGPGSLRPEVIELELAGLGAVRGLWTRYLGVLPVFPTTLLVEEAQGPAHRFVLAGRGRWLRAIAAARSAAAQENSMSETKGFERRS